MKNKSLLIVVALLHFGSLAYTQTKSLFFIENRNQWNPVVKYKADLPGGAVFLTDAGFTYSFFDLKDAIKTDGHRYNKIGIIDTADRNVHWHAYRINFSGANTDVIRYTVKEKRKEYYNFFKGKDPSRWAG